MHLRKIRRLHVKDMRVRSKKELYYKRKAVFNDLNRAVREEKPVDGSYYSGMRDMLQWVLKEID